MSRTAVWLSIACAALAGLVFFGPALFADRQFAYRDAAHFYYPLYQRVEQEWDAGRLPLWSPEENAGMPLLGNPTAAVLYPLKLIYRLAPSYAWGARLYIVAHAGLALVAAYVLARGWGISQVGSGLAALGYAYGAPVLFQYCNIIYLVGAAWLPLGLRAADAWLREGRGRAIVGLALVLAMQTLGGDPQAAYLTGVFTALYAWMLGRPPRESSGGRRWAIAIALIVAWFALAIGAAALFARDPKTLKPPPPPLPWTGAASLAIRGVWLATAGWFAWRAIRVPTGRVLGRRLGGLLVAAVLALMTSGAQLLPVLEFTSKTARSAESGPHDIYPFSVEPVRLGELAWPGLFGSFGSVRSSWLVLLTEHRPDAWVPSLYCGGVLLVCALASLGGRRAPTWTRWLWLVTIVTILASLGRFASPIWIARQFPALHPWIGAHDTPDAAAIRFDGHLRDGDGGIYWALATFLPGFGGFRYPAKLFTFATLGLSILAGAGLDRVLNGRRRGARIAASVLLFISASAVLASYAGRGGVIAWFRASVLAQSGGAQVPFSPEAAWRTMTFAFAHGALIAVATLAAIAVARRSTRWAATLLVVIQAFDLAIVNRDLIITAPQSLFEEPPELLAAIEQAERDDPFPGGHYRVHRTPLWEPRGWGLTAGPDRYRELFAWERRTIQPKYAIPYGLQYTFTQGVAELYDYEYFFAPFFATNRDPAIARAFLGHATDKPLVTFPRRGFDLWNTRYFLLPFVPENDEHRGYASFLADTTRLAPVFEDGPERDASLRDWALKEDWQLLRNRACYPRAWVVHDAIVRAPIEGLQRGDRETLMQDILYQDDPLWSSTGQPIYDPRRMAWVETNDAAHVANFLTRTPVLASETPRIVRYEPQRVELEVSMETPGLLVLADVYYPGWVLEIDGQPAPILRTNRMMRGAGVPSGSHRLVFRYDPDSLRWGLGASLAGAIGLVVVFLRAGRGRILDEAAS